MIDDPLNDRDLPADDTVELDNVDRIMIILHKRFKEQGGTGYIAHMHKNGCLCAIGALKLDLGIPLTEATPWCQITVRYGFPREETVWKAHDRAIQGAMNQTLPGIEGCPDDPLEVRALFGTPAYDFAMTELERRLRDARR